MTPQELCNVLDAMKITTRAAAKELGCHEVTLQMWCNGKRYPSHGGEKLDRVPRYIEVGVRHMLNIRGMHMED